MLFTTLLDQSQGKMLRGRTVYYNCESILDSLSATPDPMLSISESMLLTPFYLAEGTYEIYQYGFNIYLLSDSEYESEGSESQGGFSSASQKRERCCDQLTLLTLERVILILKRKLSNFISASCSNVSSCKKK